MHGKLIVIEGSDGSGKTTQINLLEKYLFKNQIQFTLLDFPFYETNFFGKMIKRYSSGNFGDTSKTSPYFLSIPFAADRWEAKPLVNKILSSGKIILSDRYVGSNAAYQGARFGGLEKEQFLKWLFELEYQVLQVPKEDLVIYLYVPVEVGQKLMEEREQKKDKNSKKRESHETDISFLEKVQENYLTFCKKYENWVKVDCTHGEKILSREEIHKKVIKVFQDKNVL